MMRESELRAWPCSRVDCSGQGLVRLDIDGADRSLISFVTLNYARNTVTYRVNLREPALVVENEIGAPGWTGVARDRPVELREVNGALRGWALQSGSYELTVQYETPLLSASRLLAVAGDWAVALPGGVRCAICCCGLVSGGFGCLGRPSLVRSSGPGLLRIDLGGEAVV